MITRDSPLSPYHKAAAGYQQASGKAPRVTLECILATTLHWGNCSFQADKRPPTPGGGPRVEPGLRQTLHPTGAAPRTRRGGGGAVPRRHLNTAALPAQSRHRPSRLGSAHQPRHSRARPPPPPGPESARAAAGPAEPQTVPDNLKAGKLMRAAPAGSCAARDLAGTHRAAPPRVARRGTGRRTRIIRVR